MVLYVTEKEMIERFGDSLKEAASRCREFSKVEVTERPEIFIRLVASLKVGAGSAHQLSMAQMNPQWLFIRDMLENFSVFAQENIFKESEGKIWSLVADELDKLSVSGHKMATDKAISRQDALDILDEREKAARLDA